MTHIHRLAGKDYTKWDAVLADHWEAFLFKIKHKNDEDREELRRIRRLKK